MKKYPEKEEIYKQSEKKEIYKQSEKKFNVMFKSNRRFELHVNREVLIFEGRKLNPIYPEKYREGIPENIINKPNFQTHKKYFNVMEV